MDVFLHGISGLSGQFVMSRRIWCFGRWGGTIWGNIPHEIVGSEIHYLVEFAHSTLGVRLVGVCLVIPRRLSRACQTFNSLAEKRNRCLSVVLDDMPFVFVWRHKGLESRHKELESLHRTILLPDGVHWHPHGKFLSMKRSYRWQQGLYFWLI